MIVVVYAPRRTCHMAAQNNFSRSRVKQTPALSEELSARSAPPLGSPVSGSRRRPEVPNGRNPNFEPGRRAAIPRVGAPLSGAGK